MNDGVWLRVLKVKLKRAVDSSSAKEIVFGDNFPDYDLNIQVNVYKYMSALKDYCTIKIDNLSYSEVIQIVMGKFYSVEIVAGYRNGNQMTVFKGAVLRINNTLLSQNRTNQIIILAGCNLIAKFSQATLNFSLQSNLNTYSAIKFITERAGVKNSSVSTQLKKSFLNQVKTETNTAGSFLEALANNNSTYILNSDSSDGMTFSIYDAALSNNRIIKIKNMQLIGGYPQLSKDGLTLSVLPTFNFMCGDVIKVDNSVISLQSTLSTSNLSNQPGYYLDKDGAYMIVQVDYELTNRSSEFSCNITAKARSLISNYIGV